MIPSLAELLSPVNRPLSVDSAREVMRGLRDAEFQVVGDAGRMVVIKQRGRLDELPDAFLGHLVSR